MIVIVDYGLGNLFSVKKAFEALGADALISGYPEDICRAERLVLPGIGAFGNGIQFLREKKLDIVLHEEVIKNQKPFLGICLGMQLLADVGFEHGKRAGLGFIRGSVLRMDAERYGLRVPHIGWNSVIPICDTFLFRKISAGAEFYFTHSFRLVCEDSNDVAATAEHGDPFTAAVVRENIAATQFHPEKSQDNGLRLLENFIQWDPHHG